ncbi:MAG: PEP/pyruvate-binding domain-containing protein [Candidatus Gottesmanbacteria bacterium]|nr:PEP/pyruvate-binding domain-containing protein [Candidatus Gottesmanbacteria bacterium]
MASLPEVRPETKDDHHLESPTGSYLFSRAIDDGTSTIPVTKDALGGKGLGLVELNNLGLPVPPGFILTTGAWCEWEASDRQLSDQLAREISQQIIGLEKNSGKRLGNPDNPLIVSVRSGAPVSMPGAMITLLNVGLNDRTVKALGKEIGEQNAWKSYLEMMIHLGVQAYGIPKDILHAVRTESLMRLGATRVSDLPVAELQAMIDRVKQIYTEAHIESPQDPQEQIQAAVHGVFASWNTPEASEYRSQNGISDHLGTAAIVQEIVWGLGKNHQAGAGVLLTRNIQTGDHIPSVAFASGKQGTAIVGERGTHQQSKVEDLPVPDHAKRELTHIVSVLEKHYRYPQDVEFTFDGGKVWLLQTRDVPLQPMAHFRVLNELIGLNKTSREDAIRRMTTPELRSLLSAPLDPDIVRAKRKSGDVLATGISISIGNASGRIISSLDEAGDYMGKPCILVMPSVSLPVITKLMDRTQYANILGLIAGNGGIGSHIARVGTRVGERMPIIFGANTKLLRSPQEITIDGATAEIFTGIIPRLQNGKNKLLTGTEYDSALAWFNAKLRNPWRYSTSEGGINQLVALGQEAITKSRDLYNSTKARAQYMINALIPDEIRLPYTVVPATDTNQMMSLAKDILARGNHVTLRTCFSPDPRGKAPWVMLTSEDQIKEFFDNPDFPWKYGGYEAWKTDPSLTEILVGEIPQNKMNEDPAVQYDFASWTVTCTELGEIIMQIRPHTAHLRGHEEASPDDLITYRLVKDPSDPGGIRVANQTVGVNLTDDGVGHNLASLSVTRLMDWWKRYNLPKRLAAAGALYPPPHFAIPVLEGQSRVGLEDWCAIYGIKSDNVEV